MTKKFKMGSFRQLGLLLFIVLLGALVQIANPKFLTPTNISSILTNTAIIAILSIGMLVVLLTGGIDLSIGSNIALSGMVAALHVKLNPGVPPVLLLVEGTLVGLVCGMLVGLLVSRLNMLPIIASLGMNYIFRGSVFLLSGGSWVSAHQMSDGFKAIATGKLLEINNLVWIAIVLYLIAQYFLTYTRTGRRFYAVGSNCEAARVSGISAVKTKFLAYSIMGALAGLCGVLWVSKFASAQPDTAVGYEINIIAACVIGGVSISGGSGKVLGVLLGSMLIGIINNALPLINFVSEFSKSFIQGSIILVAILLNTMVKRNSDYRTLVRRQI